MVRRTRLTSSTLTNTRVTQEERHKGDPKAETTGYAPLEKEQDAIDRVLSFVRHCEDSTQVIRETIIRCRRNYAGKFDSPTTKYTKRPKVFYPLTTEKIDGIEPKLSVSSTALTLYPQEEDDVVKAEVFGEVLKFQARKIGLFERFNAEWRRQLLIDGTIVVKTCWAYEEDKEGEPKRDQAQVDYVDLLDFYIDPLALSINDPSCEAVAHKKVCTLSYIKANKNYKNRKYLEGFYSVTQKTKDSSATMSHEIEQTQVDVDTKKITIIEYWTNERVITVATDEKCENGILLRDEKNPFEHGQKPFVETQYIKRVGRWYGVGCAELLLSLQNWANSVVNNRIDNQLMIINKMFLKRRSANIDIRQLVSRPAGFIEVDDIQTDIKPLEFSDSTRGALEELAQINAIADRLLSAYELVRGGGNPKTASEAIIQSEGAKGFFESKLRNIGAFFVKVFEQILQLDLQYLEEEMILRITGNEEQLKRFDELLGVPEGQQTKLPKYRFVKVKDMKILDGMYDLMIDMDLTGGSRALKLKQISDTITLAQRDPSAPVDKERLYGEMFRLMFDTDADRFVKRLTPQEMAMQQAKLMGGAASPEVQGGQGALSGNGIGAVNTEAGAQDQQLGGVRRQLEGQLGAQV